LLLNRIEIREIVNKNDFDGRSSRRLPRFLSPLRMAAAKRRIAEPPEGSAACGASGSTQNRGSLPPGSHAARYDRALDFTEYQRLSRRTACYPREAWLAYPALGLCGEAGEVAEHVKKAIRDDGGEISGERRTAMSAELGDVLWYVSQIATELELDLDEIAEANLQKLLSRQRRGVLSGSGDDR
jgi:NTP pyrophosphatase (non-canonical NTP hydrolase)